MSIVVAVVLLAESGLAIGREWSVKMPLAALDPLGTNWLLVNGLFFVGFVAAFTILSPVAGRQWKREQTLRRGLKCLIAGTSVPPRS